MDLEKLRKQLSDHLSLRSGLVKSWEDLIDGAEKRADGRLTDEESAKVAEIRAGIVKVDSDIASVEHRIADVEKVAEARARQDALADQFGQGDKRTAAVTQVNEPDIYRQGGEHSFFRDAWSARNGSLSAQTRLQRHNDFEINRMRQRGEARAATATSDLASNVTPQYLLNLFAPIVHEGRPFANLTNGGQDLPPDGMTWTLPRGNTGTVMGSQTTQNSAVRSRTYTNNDLTGPIITIAGYNDVSRQSLDRGRNTDTILMEDMVGAYADETDRQVIAGSGSNNEHWGILATTGITTVTVTSTGAITQMRQLISALGTLRTARKRQAQVIVMHPRRWAYYLQAVDSSGRPLITPTANGPFNTMGVVQGGQDFESNIAGYIHNLPVVLDANIPITLSYDVTQSSTTDPVFLTRASDLYLMEDSSVPTMIEVQPDAKNLTVTFVGWGYQGFTAGRYTTGTIVLAGSGLTTPPAVG